MGENPEAPKEEQSEGALASPEDDARLQGAVIVAIQPTDAARVLLEGSKYARLHRVPLAVVHVDVNRFVTFEDPDGYVHSAPIDLNIDAGAAEFERVLELAGQALADQDVTWEGRQLVGDPALSIKRFAERIGSPLIVVGTRKRGLGESIREFFAGSVAARLSHRQHRPVLVVPLDEPVPDDQELWIE